MEGLPDLAAVIVADDDGVIRGLLRSKLEAIDHAVLLASNGLEAVDLASRMQPKLVLLDLKMPGLDGLRTCQQIRQMPHNARTPIVILTSIVGKDAVEAARRVGATAFITKPFRSAQLMRALSYFLVISDETRAGIKDAADRAAELALPAPGWKARTTDTPGREHALFERGRNILTILRH